MAWLVMTETNDFLWQSSQDNIDWKELSELYRIAPLGKKTPKGLNIVFSNSRFKYFIFDSIVDSTSDSSSDSNTNGYNKDEKIIIGAGRALADGFDTSYICDVVIHPDYQGLGIGKKLVQTLIEDSKEHKKVIIYVNPGKEGFYTKLGFLKMNTAMAIFKDEAYAIQKGVVSRGNSQ